ncbi:hypothetical protein PGTUg99_027149 [Puccinia graminis f. sp. tritici]|uniref:Hydrophobin n=1 Tax=Puccinia graminis f. sp. tritici TaxID=56615 RepID=A0A5B0Q4J4_PUCGR|nr:hypothetical protein PGTUg99_027149 [Puccinia graminis f. sp. tritici]
MLFCKSVILFSVAIGILGSREQGGGRQHERRRAKLGGGLPQVTDDGCATGLYHYCFTQGQAYVTGASDMQTIAQIVSPVDSNGQTVLSCPNQWPRTASCCDQSKFEVLDRVDSPVKSIFITFKSFKNGCPKDKIKQNI